jgi:thymidylate kinase
MSRGLLICLSGIESSGKSTQLKRLMEYARAQVLRPFYLWTRPGYTRNLEACKRFIHSLKNGGRSRGKNEESRSESPGSPAPERQQRDYPRRAKGFDTALGRRVWLTLSLIDLIIVYGVQIRYWLWRGQTVVCDRYLWDGLVDFRNNFPDDAVESGILWRILLALTPRPDVAYFLLISVEESLHRSKLRERGFQDSEAVLQKRLEQYKLIAEQFQWPVLDGQRPVDEIAVEIQSRVEALVQAAKT